MESVRGENSGAIQRNSSGNFWGNSGSYNIYRSTTLNVNGIQVPKDIPGM